MEPGRSEMQPVQRGGNVAGNQNAATARLFTVGHSNHPPERFLALLESASITAVADVRSQPFSRRLFHVNRPELEALLREHGIVYRFLGDLLGGRPRHRKLYDGERRVDYERVRQTDFFQEGLDRLCRFLPAYRTVLLCSEEDPLVCHRGLLIAPALGERGLLAVHLRGDGRLESFQEAEDRLLDETGVGMDTFPDLFAEPVTAEERHRLLAEAYRRRARRCAFQLSPGPVRWQELEDDEPFA
jgi:hypothetical protein